MKYCDLAKYHDSPNAPQVPFDTDLAGHIEALRIVHVEIARKSGSRRMLE